MGFNNLAVREKMGLPDSTYGYIMEPWWHGQWGELQMSELIAPKIECEICFKLGDRLMGLHTTVETCSTPPRASALVRDLRRAHQGLEMPLSRFPGDNGFSARAWCFRATGFQ